jgi:TPP-dependent pyruvate/acetoin dehydrogenase alpha subunit
MDQAHIDTLQQEVQATVDAAVRFAESSPRPDPTQVAAYVYTSREEA